MKFRVRAHKRTSNRVSMSVMCVWPRGWASRCRSSAWRRSQCCWFLMASFTCSSRRCAVDSDMLCSRTDSNQSNKDVSMDGGTKSVHLCRSRVGVRHCQNDSVGERRIAFACVVLRVHIRWDLGFCLTLCVLPYSVRQSVRRFFRKTNGKT